MKVNKGKLHQSTFINEEIKKLAIKYPFLPFTQLRNKAKEALMRAEMMIGHDCDNNRPKAGVQVKQQTYSYREWSRKLTEKKKHEFTDSVFDQQKTETDLAAMENRMRNSSSSESREEESKFYSSQVDVFEFQDSENEVKSVVSVSVTAYTKKRKRRIPQVNLKTPSSRMRYRSGKSSKKTDDSYRLQTNLPEISKKCMPLPPNPFQDVTPPSIKPRNRNRSTPGRRNNTGNKQKYARRKIELDFIMSKSADSGIVTRSPINLRPRSKLRRVLTSPYVSNVDSIPSTPKPDTPIELVDPPTSEPFARITSPTTSTLGPATTSDTGLPTPTSRSASPASKLATTMSQLVTTTSELGTSTVKPVISTSRPTVPTTRSSIPSSGPVDINRLKVLVPCSANTTSTPTKRIKCSSAAFTFPVSILSNTRQNAANSCPWELRPRKRTKPAARVHFAFDIDREKESSSTESSDDESECFLVSRNMKQNFDVSSQCTRQNQNADSQETQRVTKNIGTIFRKVSISSPIETQLLNHYNADKEKLPTTTKFPNRQSSDNSPMSPLPKCSYAQRESIDVQSVSLGLDSDQKSPKVALQKPKFLQSKKSTQKGIRKSSMFDKKAIFVEECIENSLTNQIENSCPITVGELPRNPLRPTDSPTNVNSVDAANDLNCSKEIDNMEGVILESENFGLSDTCQDVIAPSFDTGSHHANGKKRMGKLVNSNSHPTPKVNKSNKISANTKQKKTTKRQHGSIVGSGDVVSVCSSSKIELPSKKKDTACNNEIFEPRILGNTMLTPGRSNRRTRKAKSTMRKKSAKCSGTTKNLDMVSKDWETEDSKRLTIPESQVPTSSQNTPNTAFVKLYRQSLFVSTESSCLTHNNTRPNHTALQLNIHDGPNKPKNVACMRYNCASTLSASGNCKSIPIEKGTREISKSNKQKNTPKPKQTNSLMAPNEQLCCEKEVNASKNEAHLPSTVTVNANNKSLENGTHDNSKHSKQMATRKPKQTNSTVLPNEQVFHGEKSNKSKNAADVPTNIPVNNNKRTSLENGICESSNSNRQKANAEQTHSPTLPKRQQLCHEKTTEDHSMNVTNNTINMAKTNTIMFSPNKNLEQETTLKTAALLSSAAKQIRKFPTKNLDVIKKKTTLSQNLEKGGKSCYLQKDHCDKQATKSPKKISKKYETVRGTSERNIEMQAEKSSKESQKTSSGNSIKPVHEISTKAVCSEEEYDEALLDNERHAEIENEIQENSAAIPDETDADRSADKTLIKFVENFTEVELSNNLSDEGKGDYYDITDETIETAVMQKSKSALKPPDDGAFLATTLVETDANGVVSKGHATHKEIIPQFVTKYKPLEFVFHSPTNKIDAQQSKLKNVNLLKQDFDAWLKELFNFSKSETSISNKNTLLCQKLNLNPVVSVKDVCSSREVDTFGDADKKQKLKKLSKVPNLHNDVSKELHVEKTCITTGDHLRSVICKNISTRQFDRSNNSTITKQAFAQDSFVSTAKYYTVPQYKGIHQSPDISKTVTAETSGVLKGLLKNIADYCKPDSFHISEVSEDFDDDLQQSSDIGVDNLQERSLEKQDESTDEERPSSWFAASNAKVTQPNGNNHKNLVTPCVSHNVTRTLFNYHFPQLNVATQKTPMKAVMQEIVNKNLYSDRNTCADAEPLYGDEMERYYGTTQCRQYNSSIENPCISANKHDFKKFFSCNADDEYPVQSVVGDGSEQNEPTIDRKERISMICKQIISEMPDPFRNNKKTFSNNRKSHIEPHAVNTMKRQSTNDAHYSVNQGSDSAWMSSYNQDIDTLTDEEDFGTYTSHNRSLTSPVPKMHPQLHTPSINTGCKSRLDKTTERQISHRVENVKTIQTGKNSHTNPFSRNSPVSNAEFSNSLYRIHNGIQSPLSGKKKQRTQSDITQISSKNSASSMLNSSRNPPQTDTEFGFSDILYRIQNGIFPLTCEKGDETLRHKKTKFLGETQKPDASEAIADATKTFFDENYIYQTNRYGELDSTPDHKATRKKRDCDTFEKDRITKKLFSNGKVNGKKRTIDNQSNKSPKSMVNLDFENILYRIQNGIQPVHCDKVHGNSKLKATPVAGKMQKLDACKSVEDIPKRLFSYKHHPDQMSKLDKTCANDKSNSVPKIRNIAQLGIAGRNALHSVEPLDRQQANNSEYEHTCMKNKHISEASAGNLCAEKNTVIISNQHKDGRNRVWTQAIKTVHTIPEITKSPYPKGKRQNPVIPRTVSDTKGVLSPIQSYGQRRFFKSRLWQTDDSVTPSFSKSKKHTLPHQSAEKKASKRKKSQLLTYDKGKLDRTPPSESDDPTWTPIPKKSGKKKCTPKTTNDNPCLIDEILLGIRNHQLAENAEAKSRDPEFQEPLPKVQRGRKEPKVVDGSVFEMFDEVKSTMDDSKRHNRVLLSCTSSPSIASVFNTTDNTWPF